MQRNNTDDIRYSHSFICLDSGSPWDSLGIPRHNFSWKLHDHIKAPLSPEIMVNFLSLSLLLILIFLICSVIYSNYREYCKAPFWSNIVLQQTSNLNSSYFITSALQICISTICYSTVKDRLEPVVFKIDS